jgi:DNA modification methylase
MWTDPPYGVDYSKKNEAMNRLKRSVMEGSPTANTGAISGDGSGFAEVLKGAMKLAFENVLAPSSAIYVAHPQGKNQFSFYRILEESGFVFRQALIWVKNNFTLVPTDYRYQHEPIWYGQKPGESRFGRMHGGIGWHGDNSQSSILKFDMPLSSKLHPTMKPVALVVLMVTNSSRPLDWVYEPFCGSGTTLIACEQLGRRCMGMELDPLYCDVIVKRWEEQTGKKAILEGSQPDESSDPDADPIPVEKS